MSHVAWNQAAAPYTISTYMSMLYKKKRNETYQLRASIFDTPIEHLCIVVANATGRAHVPEVLFSVKNFLLQYNALLVLQHLRAPPADNRCGRRLSIRIQL